MLLFVAKQWGIVANFSGLMFVGSPALAQQKVV